MRISTVDHHPHLDDDGRQHNFDSNKYADIGRRAAVPLRILDRDAATVIFRGGEFY
ncbi:hypothetical protein [Rhodococcus qingshengii]|uniref:hypothetical protein n=1 Tax=Rhodococcus qingshengii TaxID=334542 RepID=UPI001BE5BAB9|nr:hypothetical protein [Rhodococcus qingshengii]MBT2275876.1 hypothetical protein [Rhodococcus qingshengii]